MIRAFLFFGFFFLPTPFPPVSPLTQSGWKTLGKRIRNELPTENKPCFSWVMFYTNFPNFRMNSSILLRNIFMGDTGNKEALFAKSLRVVDNLLLPFRVIIRLLLIFFVFESSLSSPFSTCNHIILRISCSFSLYCYLCLSCDGSFFPFFFCLSFNVECILSDLFFPLFFMFFFSFFLFSAFRGFPGVGRCEKSSTSETVARRRRDEIVKKRRCNFNIFLLLLP